MLLSRRLFSEIFRISHTNSVPRNRVFTGVRLFLIVLIATSLLAIVIGAGAQGLRLTGEKPGENVDTKSAGEAPEEQKTATGRQYLNLDIRVVNLGEELTDVDFVAR